MAVEINPYGKLVRMLEARLARQRQALADTELQLIGAKESLLKFDAAQVGMSFEQSGKVRK